MRIISRYRDYYDGVAYSDTPLYLRAWSSTDFRGGVPPLYQLVWRHLVAAPLSRTEDCELRILGFCGRAYPFVHLRDEVHWDVERLHLHKRVRRDLGPWLEPFRLHDEVFRDQDAPILEFSGSRRYLWIGRNRRLGGLGFASVVDPYTAWQELDMYLSGPLAKQVDPVPERTQDGIRDAHGFGGESFRSRAPGAKKARRRANRKKKRRG